MKVLTESAEAGRRIYAIGAGENIGSTSNTLAIAITRTMTLVFTGRHSDGILPRLRRVRGFMVLEWIEGEGEDRQGWWI